MSSGLYSGTSGLSLGTGLYASASGLWGNSSGLIDGLGGQFSPAQLFALGEQGAWYDPSDFSTMFRDSAGVTPVTAVGQNVGLILDKSKGPTLGPELVTNGDFSGGSTTGWYIGPNVTVSVVGGEAQVTFAGSLTATGANWFSSGPVVATGDTRSFTIEFDATWVSGSGSLQVATGFTIASVIAPNSSKTRYKVAASGLKGGFGSGSRSAVVFGATAAATVWKIDNVSVKELFGNHAYQTAAANMPVIQTDGAGHYFLLFDGTDDFLQTAAINFSTTDKMTVAAGVRKATDTSYQAIVELAVNPTNTNGAFGLGANTATSDASRRTWASILSGTTLNNLAGASIFAAPITSVLGLQLDLAQSTAAAQQVLSVNGVEQAQTYSLPNAGSGNFSNNPVFIGRRGGTVQALNGRIYGLVLRGTATSAAQMAQLVAWMNSKTGAY